jgi:DUF4097 and DUF4098 domain-containing protein YvlB
MSEERARVLKMLEEGKITADQAARLIQALGAGGRTERHGVFRNPHHPPRPPRIKMAELDRIPDIVARAVSSAMQSGFGPHGDVKSEFPGKNSLFLKSVSGDVDIESCEGDSISFASTGGITKVRERGENVMIRSISGDINVKVPVQCRLDLVSVSGDIKVRNCSGSFQLKNVSGDVDLVDFEGTVQATIVSGDLDLLRVSGDLTVESKSGDIGFEPAGEFEGELISKSGDVELRLRPDADVVLDMECEERGEVSVDLDFDYETLEEGERSLRIKLGSGSRTMKIQTRKADITVRDAKEE